MASSSVLTAALHARWALSHAYTYTYSTHAVSREVFLQDHFTWLSREQLTAALHEHPRAPLHVRTLSHAYTYTHYTNSVSREVFLNDHFTWLSHEQLRRFMPAGHYHTHTHKHIQPTQSLGRFSSRIISHGSLTSSSQQRFTITSTSLFA